MLKVNGAAAEVDPEGGLLEGGAGGVGVVVGAALLVAEVAAGARGRLRGAQGRGGGGRGGLVVRGLQGLLRGFFFFGTSNVGWLAR